MLWLPAKSWCLRSHFIPHLPPAARKALIQAQRSTPAHPRSAPYFHCAARRLMLRTSRAMSLSTWNHFQSGNHQLTVREVFVQMLCQVRATASSIAFE